MQHVPLQNMACPVNYHNEVNNVREIFSMKFDNSEGL